MMPTVFIMELPALRALTVAWHFSHHIILSSIVTPKRPRHRDWLVNHRSSRSNFQSRLMSKFAFGSRAMLFSRPLSSSTTSSFQRGSAAA